MLKPPTGASRPQAAVAAVEKQPLHFIRLPLCRVPADRFGRLERGASGAASCFAVRTLYRLQRQFAAPSPSLPPHKTWFH